MKLSACVTPRSECRLPNKPAPSLTLLGRRFLDPTMTFEQSGNDDEHLCKAAACQSRASIPSVQAFKSPRGIEESAIDPHFKMQEGPSAGLGHTGCAERCAAVDAVAVPHIDAAQMGVARLDAVAVRDGHDLAVAVLLARDDHAAGGT